LIAPPLLFKFHVCGDGIRLCEKERNYSVTLKLQVVESAKGVEIWSGQKECVRMEIAEEPSRRY